MNKPISPLQFFSHLKWIDGRPLLDVIESYRQRLFMEALYTFDSDNNPQYNFVLSGRGKKNWKTADAVLATLYRFLTWPSPQGNDCFIVANDEDQANDDLALTKKIIAANPLLEREVRVLRKEIVRNDDNGALKILPAQDAVGAHGKTYLMLTYDELHGYKDYDLIEALAPDPTRLDALVWITSYDSLIKRPGIPLFDYIEQGKKGDDPKMYFSWYSGELCTDEAHIEHCGDNMEARANPSMASWNNPMYLAQQKRRLPTHKYRRLHLNLGGMIEGAFYDAEAVLNCTVDKRNQLQPIEDRKYFGFVDMSGGSSDDACLAIAHRDDAHQKSVLDLVVAQTGQPPFNPRHAVKKFANILKRYHVHSVTGDNYAGNTFKQDFLDNGITYTPCPVAKSVLYESLEPTINAGEIELLDFPKLQEQLLGLTVRGTKIDHLPGEHDDLANAAAGALWLAAPTYAASNPDDVMEAIAINSQFTNASAFWR